MRRAGAPQASNSAPCGGWGDHRSRAASFPRRLAEAFVCLACLLFPLASPAADVPYLTGRVVDEAGILSSDAREKLSGISKAHEDKTSNQLVVLTVPTLGGESIEDYATRVFGEWKLGQRGKDNGVLMIVVPNDRRMRIEVGYGLEGTLPDVAASRIIRERMAPRFKSGDYDGGVIEGVNAIVAQLEGRAATEAGAGTAAPPRAQSVFDSEQVKSFEKDLPPWPMRILLGAFIFGIIGVFTFVGIVTPGVGWFLYFFLIPFWAMFPIVVVGVKGALVLLSIYVVGFPIAKLVLKSRPWYQKASDELRRTGHATVGGMVITSGGSSSGGGSGGGGGFSGGGGSSGGGGASGSW